MLLQAISKAIVLMCMGLGFGLTFITIREWVRNGFDLLPPDDREFSQLNTEEKQNEQIK